MPGIERINRELARLDADLRANRIDRAGFRARRRQVLLDFEERDSTTTPAAAASGATTATVPSPAPAGSRSVPSPEPGPKSVRLLMTAVAALVVLVIGALWFFGSRDGARLSTATRPPPAAEAAADPALPQGVADALMKSAWNAADVNTFLDRWARLSPEAINAASDDPRIWLLRGEAEQQLRAAREAESVDSSPEALARSAQLQRLHDSIRAQ